MVLGSSPIAVIIKNVSGNLSGKYDHAKIYVTNAHKST